MRPIAPHGIAFGQALERALVEAVVIQGTPRDSRAPVEVRVDYETVVSGHSMNLSRRGIFIRTPHPLPVNQKLTLRFRLPGIAEAFQVHGEVIWSNPKPAKTYPQGMGVKFLDLPREREEQLGTFVAQVRRKRGLDRIVDLRGRPQQGEEAS